jgi:hypothetical protein
MVDFQMSPCLGSLKEMGDLGLASYQVGQWFQPSRRVVFGGTTSVKAFDVWC